MADKKKKRSQFSDSESEDDTAEILARANKLQKQMKSRPKLSKNKALEDSVLLSVCKMAEGRMGVFSKDKSFSLIEINAYRSDSYSEIACKAAKKCRLAPVEGKTLSLFKLNGALILDEEVTINGKVKLWTIGNYLLLMKKSPANIKLGVGYRTSDNNKGTADSEAHSSEASTNSQSRKYYERSGDEILTVLYISEVAGRGKTLMDRRQLGICQPEKDGYKVASFSRGSELILSPLNVGGASYIMVSLTSPICHGVDDTEFFVRCEGPESVILRGNTDMALYCVSSTHGGTKYVWQMIGMSKTFPSTPIIFVNKAGLYQCCMQYNGQEIKGKVMTVSVDVDLSSGDSERDSPPPRAATKAVSQAKQVSECPPRLRKKDKRGAPFLKSLLASPIPSGLEQESSASGSVVVIPDPEHESGMSGGMTDLPSVPEGLGSSDFQAAPAGQSEVDSGHESGVTLLAAKDSETGGSVGEPAGPASKCTTVKPPALSSQRATVLSATALLNAMQFVEGDVIRATKNFSEKLGLGGFGVVYRGRLNGCGVAVKKLTEDTALAAAKKENLLVPERFTMSGQLQAELQALKRCRHRNLVNLMGYCLAPPMLIYEFMEEGTLDSKLFGTSTPLTWQQRSRIMKDICRGLVWLHSAIPPLVHGDVKSVNILIDKYFTGKLGDFGLTQELPLSTLGHTMVTMASVAKSVGYSPPEADTCHLSPKSDMYSYGVVALETFSGESAYRAEREDPLLTEYLDDHRKSVSGYQKMADKRAGELAHYLLLLYQKVIESCLVKHSKRASSSQVMKWWEDTNF